MQFQVLHWLFAGVAEIQLLETYPKIDEPVNLNITMKRYAAEKEQKIAGIVE